MIFDTHAHYDDPAFDQDRNELLLGMKEQNVGLIVNVGASLSSCQKTLKLAESYPFLYGALGVHPSDTAYLTEKDMDWLKKKAAGKKIVAIGEIGLDYHYEEPNREVQKKWFIRQLQIAQEMSMPVIIHSREAAADTMEILKKYGKTRGVIHCYSYAREQAEEYCSMGYCFGIGGVLTFKNAKKLVEAVKIIPLDRILLETDCPYLAPEPFRGKRNQSAYIDHVAQKLAELKGISKEQAIEATARNAMEFYGICEKEEA